MEKVYEIEEILSRLKFALKAATWKDVASFLGEKEGTVSAWKANNRQGCIEKILYKSRGVAAERWLLTGEGPMQGPGVMSATLTGKGALTAAPPEPSNVAPGPQPMPVVWGGRKAGNKVSGALQRAARRVGETRLGEREEEGEDYAAPTPL